MRARVCARVHVRACVGGWVCGIWQTLKLYSTKYGLLSGREVARGKEMVEVCVCVCVRVLISG